MNDTSPRHEALNQRAVDLLKRGLLPEALVCLKEAISLHPARAALHFNAAYECLQTGSPKALDYIRQALRLDPNDPESWMLRGKIESSFQLLEDCYESFIRAAVIMPTNPLPLAELAAACTKLGKYESAVLHFRHALSLAPNNISVLLGLGELYHELGMLDPARQILSKATTLAPNNAAAHLSLGATLYKLTEFRLALQHLKHSEQLFPESGVLHNNLGMVYNAFSDSSAASKHFHQAISLEPGLVSAWSNLLLHMHYQPEILPQEILAQAQAFNRRIAPAQQPVLTARQIAPGDRIRIGYVSGDLRQHAVGLFIEPVLQHHDKSKFEIFAYADVNTPDNRSQRIQEIVDHWIDCSAWTDDNLLARIRADGIDILIDLAGHTANNRLVVFAQRAAPLQLSWLGYPGTTGLSAMDYLVSDVIADPNDVTQRYITEKPLRLAHGMFCYQPLNDWANDTPLAPPPVLKNGFITFASFNNLAKVNDHCLALWRDVMDDVPDSRLLIKGKPFADARLTADWVERICKSGLDPDRIELQPYQDLKGHFISYNAVDIHLDTTPYGGGTTTWDALWMGVPVVTLAGDHRQSRVGASILNHAAHNEWAARSDTEYVEIAKRLATDISALCKTRQHLREELLSRPVCNPKIFTGEWESALLTLLPQK
jgi:protein O-GlcNAc transferase